MTVSETLSAAKARLQNISDAPALDAERLLLVALGQTESSWLFAHPDFAIPQSQLEPFNTALEQRCLGRPLAYIIGAQWFYGREFAVTPDVLIPRPETEQLVDKALAVMPALRQKLGHPLVVADIGTGSGCIAITLALEATPNIIQTIYATDVSPAALDVARHNSKKFGTDPRITFLEGNLLEPLSGKPLDLIVSNPPYVPSAEIALAHQSPATRGLSFEPRLALDGGPDGSQYVTQIAQAGIPAIVETKNGKIQTFNV